MQYQYEDKSTSPDLSQIHLDIAASEMTSKTIEFCRWDEETELLKVNFTGTLSGADESTLGTIIKNNS